MIIAAALIEGATFFALIVIGFPKLTGAARAGDRGRVAGAARRASASPIQMTRSDREVFDP